MRCRWGSKLVIDALEFATGELQPVIAQLATATTAHLDDIKAQLAATVEKSHAATRQGNEYGEALDFMLHQKSDTENTADVLRYSRQKFMQKLVSRNILKITS